MAYAVPVRRPLGAPFDLDLRLPGSKSITNRLFVLAALAGGTSRVRDPLVSDDCDRLAAAFETLGVGVERDGESCVTFAGCGGVLPASSTSSTTVNLGDGGTPSRFMLAAATLADFEVIVDGSARMRERPMAEGAAMLRELGAAISGDSLPMRVAPKRPQGGTVNVGATHSSQFISAVMLIAPWLRNGVTIRYTDAPTSITYVMLTAHVMRQVGITVEVDHNLATGRPTIHIPYGPPSPFDITVEADASTAIYWQLAATLHPGSTIRIPNLPATSNQPDLWLMRELASVAARIEADSDDANALRIVSRNSHAMPKSFEIDATRAPDGAIAAAALAAYCDGTSTLTGLHTLRVKESDRITATATELERLGCSVTTGDDFITIDPVNRHNDGVTVAAWNDHRMAMAFGILGMKRPGTLVEDPGCVAKSHPGFWSDVERVVASSIA